MFLLMALRIQESRGFGWQVILWHRLVPCVRIAINSSVGIWPGAIMQALNNRFYKRLIWVSEEKELKTQNIDKCDNGKEWRVFWYSVDSSLIKKSEVGGSSKGRVVLVAVADGVTKVLWSFHRRLWKKSRMVTCMHCRHYVWFQMVWCSR